MLLTCSLYNLHNLHNLQKKRSNYAYMEDTALREQEKLKRAWLITWNPEYWAWESYKDWYEGTKKGQRYTEAWSCLSKQPVLGDDVFVMKIGRQPRGIIAHGTVDRESYDISPDEKGYIDIAFDKLLDYENGVFLLQEDLKEKLPAQTWSPRVSGIEIKTDVLSEFWKMWKKLNGEQEPLLEQEEQETLKMRFARNTILYGPPGTGKTYSMIKYAVAICDNRSVEERTDYDVALARFKELKNDGRIIFTTFHQSYGYEEFIEGIRPTVDSSDDSKLSYKVEPGIFKEFCDRARAFDSFVGENRSQDTKHIPYVFLIDEINRGNISKIFGELITLIEDTKRSGTQEEMSAILPYSGKSFSVPDNVYILGTMNTADRSIAFMDTALRRRFCFIEMMPDSKVLSGIEIKADAETLNIARMLDIMNERIECLYDREHTIGHAFFTRLKSSPDLDVLAEIFRSEVIPLLQEYFYEDYAKIQLVLGDNGKSNDKYKFLLDEPIKVKNVFKGNPEDIDVLPEKRYRIQEGAFTRIQSYKEIGIDL